MKKFVLDCPVPKDQQPMNEYLALKASIFFCWTTKELSEYLKHVLLLSSSVYAFATVLIYLSIPSLGTNPDIKVFSYIIILGNSLLSLYFIRLYLGWLYIYNRLLKSSVTYEESGWYDGQTWVKPPNVLMQDKLVAEYQLFPILQNLKLTITILFLSLLVVLSYGH